LLLWATLSRLTSGYSLKYIKTPFYSSHAINLVLNKFALSFFL
jgi:hypothetical protein